MIWHFFVLIKVFMYQQRFSNRNNRNNRSSGSNSRRSHAVKSFNPSLLVNNKPALAPDEEYQIKNSFGNFSLISQLQLNIKDKGYTTPTPIQDQAIPALLSDRDLIGIANTGTGKTAAFLIPLINKVCANRLEKVLIITPTRELAIQINDEFKSLSKRLNLFSTVCIGGTSLGRQITELRRSPNFVIGTPGRLKDLEQRRAVKFSYFKSLVLDEVDRMLDMGFIHDIRHIVSLLPKDRQSLFFSATLPADIQSLANEFLTNPITIRLKQANTAANIEQKIIKTNGQNKLDLLHELLIKDEFNKVLVFGRTKWGMEKLSKALQERGFRTVTIHGNKSQHQRQMALEQFKSNKAKILLATDVASRGLDIANVSHVINYDLPESYEAYIHRIGRTGRADKKGVALSFVG